MDVPVTELRASLSDWLAQVRDGGEIVVTERGLPVARIVGVHTTSKIEELTAAGVIARPTTPHRSKAAGRKLPKARRSVADLVSEQRR